MHFSKVLPFTDKNDVASLGVSRPLLKGIDTPEHRHVFFG